tara:strand:- start:831 stop:1889 length:1059 start_codon:yes stop_codon:yes gene_type:complete
MAITKKDVMKMIKEELKKVLMEDLSLLRDMTPGDVLEYMRRELNGKTWFFWDLESIGFDGQITQYGAIAFKIDDIDGPIPEQPIAEFDVNVALNQETLEKYIAQQDMIDRAEEIFDEYERTGQVTREVDFLLKVQKEKEEGRPYTVADMIGYTNYQTREDDRDEYEAMEEFLAWVEALGPNVVSVGHNIKTFDRNKIIKEGEALGIDTTSFQQIDIFDTVNFQRQVLKGIAEYEASKGDRRLVKFFDEKEKEVNGEIKTIISFNGKLQRMMDVYGPGPDYIQLHTAIDDTRQLITAFFNMYSHVKEIITTSDEVASLSSNINVSRAQRELGIKDIKNPTDISRAIRKARSDP